MGMYLPIFNWIMDCVESISFAVLINNSPSRSFLDSRGLRKVSPLFPFFFLTIVDALSKLIHDARLKGELMGVKVSDQESITHLLFVDDVLCDQGTP